MLKFFGQFHPSIIHFPVVLLILAALAELLFLIKPERFPRYLVSFNLYLAAPSAVLAAGMGWCLAVTQGVTPDLKSALVWHRWLGTGTAVIAIALLIVWRYAFGAKSKPVTLLFRVLIFSGALLVAITGHLGGQLVYGADWYEWSFK